MFSFGNKQTVDALQKISFDVFTDLQDIPSSLNLPHSNGIQSQLNRVLGLYYNRILWESNNVHLVNQTISSGLWNMDIGPGNQVIAAYWSDDFRHMIGYNNVHDFPNKLESWSDLLHPEDKDRTLSLFVKTLEDHSGKTKYDLEYRLKTRNQDIAGTGRRAMYSATNRARLSSLLAFLWMSMRNMRARWSWIIY